MKKEELIRSVETALGKKRIGELAAIVAENRELTRDLIDLSFHTDKVIAFRMSWILENLFFDHQSAFFFHLDYFMEKYPFQTNDSCRRHFTKIMMEISLFSKDTSRSWSDVIEATFLWLTEPGAPVAVQANCLDILYELRGKDDWISEELQSQIEFILKDGTAAIQSRGKRVLARLNQNRKRK